jgi:hypothetical protein
MSDTKPRPRPDNGKRGIQPSTSLGPLPPRPTVNQVPIETITVSMDDAASILDYLDAAGRGMSEYGAPWEAFDELDALKRRLYPLVFGEEMPIDPPTMPHEQTATDQALTAISNRYIDQRYVSAFIESPDWVSE